MIRSLCTTSYWRYTITLIVAVVVLGPLFSQAQFNPEINYQAKLTDDTGMAVTNGNYDIVFSLYTASTSGSAIWTESRTGSNQVTVTNGLFSVMLGDVASLASVDFNQTLYLGVTVGADSEMSPRKVLGAVPAAFVAETANELGGVASSSFLRSDQADVLEATSASTLLTVTQNGAGNILDLLDGATNVFTVRDGGNVGIGTTTPGSRLTVAGDVRITGALRDSSNSAGTNGFVLQTTGSGTQWVATSSLGFSSQTLSLGTDNQIPFINSAGSDLEYSANFTFDGTNFVLGTDVGLSRGAANRLDLATGDSLNLVSGALQIFGTNYLTGNNTSRSVTLGEAAGSNFTNSTIRNVAIGYQAGAFASNSNADYNVYIGNSAGVNNTGLDNVIIGNTTGSGNTGNYNTLLGSFAGSGNTGNSNNLVGYYAGGENRGLNNNIIGLSSGFNNAGRNNNILGENTAYNNTGSYSEFIGFEAAGRMSASNTIAIGQSALRGGSGSVTSGNAATTTNNTALGAFAGYSAQTGADNNLLLGYRSGYSLTTGANNIIIGYDVEAPSNTGSNQLNIGNLLFGTGVDGTGTTTSTGNIGIGTTSPSSKLTVAGDVRITGALRDSNNSAGTNGFVLQSSGTGFAWVATSTLGITGASTLTALTDTTITSPVDGEILQYNGSAWVNVATSSLGISGGSSLFTDGGATTYLTSLTDNLALGTTTATARLSMERTGYTGTGVVGLLQDIGVAQSATGQVAFGSRTNITNSSTATTTIAGGFIRIADNTTFGNTIRGLEVQADLGTNTQGENTGISSFGRTFGIRGTTNATAGGDFDPAGVFAELTGGTQGNALRAYSNNITSATLVNFLQESTTFTGTGLLMDFAQDSGTFTGNFLDLRDAGTTRFLVAADGDTYIGGNLGVGTTTPSSKLDVWGDMRVGTSSVPTLFVNSLANEVVVNTINPTNNLEVKKGINTGSFDLSFTNFDNAAPVAAMFSINDGGTLPNRLASSTASIERSGFIGTGQNRSGTTLSISENLSASIGQTGTVSGSLLNVSRTNGAFSSGTILNVSGTLASYADSCSPSSGGVCNSTSDVLQLSQAAVSNTGATLNITTASTNGGLVFRANDDGTLTDSTPTVIDANGNVGIGTTSPSSKLTVAGDVRITGALRDSNNSAGTSGFVLQSTGSGTQWVATSTLGIGGGSSVTFGTDNQIPFMNAGGTDFEYSSNFTFDGSLVSLGGTGLSLTGTTANIALGSNWLSGDGADEGVYVDSAGRVGIGTSTIQSGNALTTGGSVWVNGDVTVPSTGGFLRAGGSRVYLQSTDNIVAFYTNGAEVGRFNEAAGNLGIGDINPDARLEVSGNGGTVDLFMLSSNDDSDGNIMLVQDTGEVGIGKTVGLVARLSVQATGTADILNLFETGGSEVLTVLESGDVGIGTTSPSSKLTVAGDVRITGALRDSNNSAGTSGFVLQSTGTGFAWVATSTLGIGGGGSSTFLGLTDTPGAFTANRIPFTNTGATALTDSANFTFNGTTNTLAITGSTTISNTLTVEGVSRVNNGFGINIDAPVSGGLYFNRPTGGDPFINFFEAGSQIGQIRADFGERRIYFSDNSGATQYLTVNTGGASAGNVGIGSSTPSSRLTVVGDVSISGALRDNTGSAGTTGFVLQSTGTGFAWVATSTLGIAGGASVTFGTDNQIPFMNAGGSDFEYASTLTYNGTDLNLGGTNGIAFGGTRVLSASTTLSNYLFGQGAGDSITSGTNNIAIGGQALENLITGTGNVAVGITAGRDTTGDLNTFIGNSSGFSNTSGGNNTFVGYAAGFSNTTGGSNSLFGDSSGNSLVSGSENTFLGQSSAINLATSSRSVVVGMAAAEGGTAYAADNLVVFGYRAGASLATGANNNLLLGYQAADSLTTGANNIIIGYDVEAPSNTGSNQLNIGNLLFGTGIDGTGTTLSSGNIGIGTSSPSAKLTVAGDINTTGAYQINGQDVYSYFDPGGGNNTILIGVGATGVGFNTIVIGDGADGTNADNSVVINGDSNGFNTLNIIGSGQAGASFTNVIGSGFVNYTAQENATYLGFSDNGNTSVRGHALFLTGQASGSFEEASIFNINAGWANSVHSTRRSTVDFNVFDTTGSSTFLTAYSDGSNPVAALVPNGGNVGIGTTTPSSRLTVAGDSLTTGRQLVGSTVDLDGIVNFGAFAGATTDGIMALEDTFSDFSFNSVAGMGLVMDVNPGTNYVGAGTGVATGIANYVETRAGNSFNLNQLAGTDIRVNNSGDGDIDTVAGQFINITNTGTGNIIDTFGLFIGDITSGSQTNVFSIYAEDVNAPSYFGGDVGIGTTTPRARLSLQQTGITGAGVSGIDQYLDYTNSTASAVMYGNYAFNNFAPTATSTLVANMIRVADNTTLGNTIRGLEVQVERGVNTFGENTAISGFARTFGVRGVTEADAGGSFEPAGGFFESRGTTQGNAIRGYSGTVTSAALMQLFQDTSAFTGTGLLMNFGNAGGSFSSTTASRFIDLQNAGSSRFTVGAYGMLTIGNGGTTNSAGIQIGYGGLCVDNDGACTANVNGRIASVSQFSGNSDLAEMYFSSENLLPGEIVYAKGGLSIGRADEETAQNIIGVVSTKPGVLLGYDDTSLVAGEEGYPVALSGRVPIRLSTENGPIAVGDELMLSSIPGVAMKATSTGKVIGMALEAFNEARAYSDTYINQFGDDIADPVYTPVTAITDPRINDGCYYGGGAATNEALCVPLTGTTTDAQVLEAEQLAAAAAQAEALEALRYVPSTTVTLDDGETVQVGQIVMFVDLRTKYLTSGSLAFMESLMGASTTVESIGGEDQPLFERVLALASRFVDGVLSVLTLKADRVETNELCVDGVCVTADDLRRMLDSAPAAAVESTNDSATTGGSQAAPDTTESDTVTEPNDATDTETITEPVATSTPAPEPEAETIEESSPENQGTDTTESVGEEVVEVVEGTATTSDPEPEVIQAEEAPETVENTSENEPQAAPVEVAPATE